MNIVVQQSEEYGFRASLIDAGLVTESIQSGSIVGNIYKGRILRKLPQLSALSVDIGLKTPAFLSVEDTQMYNQGDPLLVQITTNPRDNRGPRGTLEISIPGFSVILLGGVTMSGAMASKNIRDDKKRRSLKRAVTGELTEKNMGAIIRTAAEDVEPEDVRKEFSALKQRLYKLIQDYEYYSSPKLLLNAQTPEYALCRLYTNEVNEIVFNSIELCEHVCEALPEHIKQRLSISVDESVKIPGETVKYLRHGDRLKLSLASGGNIVVERTEAMTVIDVNSGNCREEDKEKTVLKTNMEAAAEAVRVLRENNVSGMIVIDFIDMNDKDFYRQVDEKIQSLLTADTAKTKRFGFTAMGLYEMTRKTRL